MMYGSEPEVLLFLWSLFCHSVNLTLRFNHLFLNIGLFYTKFSETTFLFLQNSDIISQIKLSICSHNSLIEILIRFNLQINHENLIPQ